VTRSFTPQHCSTITRLAYYRSATPAPTDQSHVFELIALQSLDIDISSDPAMHSKFTKLQRLTSLTLRLDKFVKVDLQSLFWTSLRSLSRLELPKRIDERLGNETKSLLLDQDTSAPWPTLKKRIMLLIMARVLLSFSSFL
jgi:hypothetical protein